LESGKEVLTLHQQVTSAGQELARALRRAPAYYLEVARLNRERGGRARFAEIREQYELVARMWDALAQRAREQARELDVHQAEGGHLALLREQNRFLEDFRNDLRALRAGSPADRVAYRQLLKRTAEHARMIKVLKRSIQEFTDKVGPARGPTTATRATPK
jgi:hypothetical protein